MRPDAADGQRRSVSSDAVMSRAPRVVAESVQREPVLRRRGSDRSLSDTLLSEGEQKHKLSTAGTAVLSTSLSLGHYEANGEQGVHTLVGEVEIEVVPLYEQQELEQAEVVPRTRSAASRGTMFKLTGSSDAAKFHIWSAGVLVGQAHLLVQRNEAARCTTRLPVYSMSDPQQEIGSIVVSYMVANEWKDKAAPTAAAPPRVPFPWHSTFGVQIGHRGFGSTKTRLGVGENTILAFETAFKQGLRWAEFDVQLTKDNVSVLFHDLELPKRNGKQMVIKDVSWNELKEFEPRPPHVGQRLPRTRSMAEVPTYGQSQYQLGEYTVHEPFPTLKRVLQRVPIEMGFNVELKYAELKSEEAFFVNRNMFVDTILSVVARYVGSRNIVYSSFDPDICALLKEKQDMFPVLFLTEGGFANKDDIRRNSLEAAIQWAKLNRLDGICAQADLIFPEKASLVEELHRDGLLLFTWGDMNNQPQYVRMQKDAKVNGIISDRWNVEQRQGHKA